MNYAEQKSKNFSAYCRDGKMKYVEKWIDNPNVNINWNYNSPLRQAVRYKQIDVIKMLLSKDKLDTDYGNGRELKGELNGTNVVFNPITEAMKIKQFNILALFVKSGKFNFKRPEYLDVLLVMQDNEMNAYFLKLDGMQEFVMELGNKYIKLLPEAVQEIFVF